MLVAIVPVKPLRLAKGRLARLLDVSERRALALAMLGDVLAALASARYVERVGVVSADLAVLAQADALGADALRDTSPDLNTALAQAAGHYANLGATATLALPADVPLVTPAEIDQLIAGQGRAPGVVIAPSRDGGTNALLVQPPLALPFLFGAGSLARHLQAARAHGLPTSFFYGPGLTLDIDRPDDVLALAERDGETAAQRLARELSVCERVMCV